MDDDVLTEKEWDEVEYVEEEQDPNLDPGFSSWDDDYRYLYG